MIVDIVERPDLEQLTRENQLRVGCCPSCGATVPLPAALLLLYRPGGEPVLLIGIPAGDEPQDQDVANALLSRLRDSIGPAWRDEWLLDLVAVAWDDLIAGLHRETQPDPIVMLDQLAAALDPETDPETRLAVHSELAGFYKELALKGHTQALARAIEHFTAALEDATESESAARLHNSLAALLVEAPSRDHAASIELAIAHARKAVAASDLKSLARPSAYANLGTALINRVAGDRALGLEEAIDVLSRASALFTDLGLDEARARADMALGQALVERINGRHDDNVERALALIESSVSTLIDAGSSYAAFALVALGNTYAHRPSGSQQENLEKAVKIYERGIALPGVSPYQLAPLHVDTGNAYRDLARNKWGPIGPAIEHYRAALRLTGPRTPVSAAEVLQNLAWALDFRDAPGDADQAAAMLAAAADEFARSGSARKERRALRELGDMVFARQDWQAAADAFTRAAAVDDPLFSGAESLIGRRTEIGATGRMHKRWAYALLRMDRPVDALVAFERGRTRMLRLARSASLTDTESPAEPADALRHFHAAAPPGGALVALVTSSQGGAAIILTGGASPLAHDERVHVVWLDQLDDDLIQAMLVSRACAVDADDDEFEAMMGAVSSTIYIASLDDDISGLCRRLWNVVIGPIEDKLRSLHLPEDCPLTLLPSGGLGLLPLHAATLPDDPGRAFIDLHPVTLAPSVAAVLSPPADSRREGTVLVVADPTSDLPYAALEGALVASCFGSRRADVLAGPAATAAAMLERISETRPSHLHLACHGDYGWADPGLSRLHLAQGTLAIADVEGVVASGGVTSVMLSACESGVSELGSTMEEYLGWPTAFAQAGVATVISTLWRIPDTSATLLTAEFYRRHLAGATPAEALRQAQCWLRDADRDTLLLWLSERGQELQDQLAVELLREELREDWSPAERPFADPADWAAFIVTGR
jgi:CHAT domain-containing protein/tetratricopeptide (TPR) repeat protein